MDAEFNALFKRLFSLRKTDDGGGGKPAPAPGTPGTAARRETGSRDNRPVPRKFLGIYFRCCTIYGRIYKNAAGTAYEGRCPRCGMPTKVLIGTGGTSNRFFEAE